MNDFTENYKCTMWKFQDFSAAQILREINFGHLRTPKTDILTIFKSISEV